MNLKWVIVGGVAAIVLVLTSGITIGVKHSNRHTEPNVTEETEETVVAEGNTDLPTEGQESGANVGVPRVPVVPGTPTVPKGTAGAGLPTAGPTPRTVLPEMPRARGTGPNELTDEEILEMLTPEQLQLILPPEPEIMAQEASVLARETATHLQGAGARPGDAGREAASPRPAVFRGHPDIKVYTLDNNVAKANDVTKVDVGVGPDTFIYKFKDGVECVQVKFRNKTLWVHDANAHGNNYPREVSFFAAFDLIYVHMNDTWVYTYSYKNGTWTLFRTNLNGRPAKLTPPPAGRKITYERETAASGMDNDLPLGREVTEHPDITITSCKNLGEGRVNNKSDYRVFEHGAILTFWFEKGAKCLKVDYKGAVAWKHDLAEHKTNYPKSVEFNKTTKLLEVNFNSDWNYGFMLNASTNKWELKNKRLVMKPGELPQLMKKVFNIDLAVSPSLLLYFSGMSIRTIRFFLNFYPTIDAGLKTLIDKLYNSDMYWETLPAIVANPDQLPKLMDMIKGTSLAVDEARLNNLIANPDLLLHLLKELKAVGFNVDELLKKLLADPVKLNTLLVKMRSLGYALNETEIKKLGKNAALLTYLKAKPMADNALGTTGTGGLAAGGSKGTGVSPGSPEPTAKPEAKGGQEGTLPESTVLAGPKVPEAKGPAASVPGPEAGPEPASPTPLAPKAEAVPTEPKASGVGVGAGVSGLGVGGVSEPNIIKVRLPGADEPLGDRAGGARPGVGVGGAGVPGGVPGTTGLQGPGGVAGVGAPDAASAAASAA